MGSGTDQLAGTERTQPMSIILSPSNVCQSHQEIFDPYPVDSISHPVNDLTPVEFLDESSSSPFSHEGLESGLDNSLHHLWPTIQSARETYSQMLYNFGPVDLDSYHHTINPFPSHPLSQNHHFPSVTLSQPLLDIPHDASITDLVIFGDSMWNSSMDTGPTSLDSFTLARPYSLPYVFTLGLLKFDN